MPGAHTKRDAAARNAPRHDQVGLAAGSAGAQPEPYDGPGSNSGEARGRSGSVAGIRSSSRPGSQVRASSRTRPAVDPARDPTPQVLLRNVDFGGAAYNIFSQVSPKLAYLPTVSLSLCALDSRFLACLCVEIVKPVSLLPNDLHESECWLAFCYCTKESCCVTSSASHLQSQHRPYSYHSYSLPPPIHAPKSFTSRHPSLFKPPPAPTLHPSYNIFLHQHPLHPTSPILSYALHLSKLYTTLLLLHTSTLYYFGIQSVGISTSNFTLQCLNKSIYTHHVFL